MPLFGVRICPMSLSQILLQASELMHFIVVKNFDYIDTSSTNIKENLNNSNLDPRVYNYILEHNLYSNKKSSL